MVANGAMYYAEQVLMFMAIERLSTLAFSVADTDIKKVGDCGSDGYLLRGRREIGYLSERESN